MYTYILFFPTPGTPKPLSPIDINLENFTNCRGRSKVHNHETPRNRSTVRFELSFARNLYIVRKIKSRIEMNMVEEYVNASKAQYRDAFDIIEEFKKEMSEMRGKCIDIGCGPGDVTKKLILPRLSLEAELVGKGTRGKG